MTIVFEKRKAISCRHLSGITIENGVATYNEEGGRTGTVRGTYPATEDGLVAAWHSVDTQGVPGVHFAAK